MATVDSMLRWWRGGIIVDHAPPTPVPETVAAEEPTYLGRLDEAGIPRTLTYASTTLGRMLDQTADRFGPSVAVVYRDPRWTYRDLLQDVNRLAGGLASLGVERGDRVLLTLPNCPEYVTSFFAIQKLGAIVVNVGPLAGADDLAGMINLTAPRAVIGLDLQARLLDRIGRGTSIEHFVWVTLQSYQGVFKRLGYQYKLWHDREKSTGSARHVTLAALLHRAPARPPTVLPAEEDAAVLQPTGGTSGSPKLAELSHRSLLANAMQVSVWMQDHAGQETVLTALPMFHVYGLMTCLLTGVFSASRLILLTRFAAAEVLATMRREKPTVFPLVPAICDAISNEIEKDPDAPPLEKLRLCISGSAPLPLSIAERFERLTGARVIEGYGLSEASPVTHANLPGRARLGTIGLPLPDTRCRIVDPDDPEHELPAGTAGELLISGPQLMSGYYGNPAQTKAALRRDAEGRTWLHTGDMARMSPDGYFTIIDRKKEMIIRSGLKIYPAKVEKVLSMHPAVKEAAVVGRADLVHTQAVVAFVVSTLAAEDRDGLVVELKKLCREHLAPYEVPAEFVFLPALPRSPLGKLLKKDLVLPAAAEGPTPSSSPATVTPADAKSNGNGNGETHGRLEHA